MKTDDVIYNDNKIIFEQKEFSLPHKIIDAKFIEDFFIIVFSYDEPDLDKNRNLYCYTKDGLLKWQVEAQKESELHWGASRGNPFVGVNAWPDGTIHASTFSGMHYILDVNTGKLIKDQSYRL